jgi:copper homeostasis protein
VVKNNTIFGAVQLPKLEIACFNTASAEIAQAAGADRIELCDGIAAGGTTPALDVIEQVRIKLHIDLFVMIRPRGGNFVYSSEEFKQMKSSIPEIKALGVNGFVFGILKADNSIDTERNTELVKLAAPLPCTFHRAFDEVQNPSGALEEVIACGFKTILTSGQKANAIEGIGNLETLIKRANERIVIMPGGGVRSSNISELQQKLNTSFFHSSAITDRSDTASEEEVIALKTKLHA